MTAKIIGIDPDLVKSGVAVTAGGKILTLDAMGFFDLIGFIDEHKHQAVFHLEDVASNRAVYQRNTNQAGMRKIAQTLARLKPLFDCWLNTLKVRALIIR